MYRYLFIGRDKSFLRILIILLLSNFPYFVKSHSKPNNKYKQGDIIQMHFLIDNTFVQFCGQVFLQTIDIQMRTNCASLLVDLFLHTNETGLISGLHKNKDRTLAKIFRDIYMMLCHWTILHSVNICISSIQMSLN